MEERMLRPGLPNTFDISFYLLHEGSLIPNPCRKSLSDIYRKARENFAKLTK